MTTAEFLVLFHEFAALAVEDGGTELIDGALARAARRVSDSWGDKRDDVIGLTTAHMLALSPWGRNARLSDAKNVTTYGVELDAMKRGHAFARHRVVEQDPIDPRTGGSYGSC